VRNVCSSQSRDGVPRNRCQFEASSRQIVRGSFSTGPPSRQGTPSGASSATARGAGAELTVIGPNPLTEVGGLTVAEDVLRAGATGVGRGGSITKPTR